ncbi:MAG: hypothetical protein LHW64_01840 [Candidatus Cloacimonetes bacterium]|jgi:hypothetical protein|nr:hypothetical protein [Candidatus Cloacimonadota bacterium]MCB5286528.1 hypothetical protein [Candidatus Cloacimonadota bacterium]MCK9185521.1 hypothetical protein [Candidatus Cloacimonadota bacterium]MCK9583779.1 hypothetical protein [Candidatus Cloacimonadota bacterium]MDY0228850.1 hypothetical protein [Candidatus Cloacimonadaceae bacterium]
MKVLICCVILIICLPLAAGTFLPLSSFEDARITDFEFSLKWATLLNLGSCVYEEDLWYNCGINEAAFVAPQIQLQKALTEDMQMGLEAFTIGDLPNQAFYVKLNLKRLLEQNENAVFSLNPSAGYSRNRFSPWELRLKPYLDQKPGSQQDSQAFFAQLPLLVYLKKPGINCCVKLGYSRFEAKARYLVTEHDAEPAMQDFSYGPHDLVNAGISVNLPIKIGWLRIRPELGYEVFSLVQHEDMFSGSVTGGLAFSFVWPQQ